jgi:hypothetical protein
MSKELEDRIESLVGKWDAWYANLGETPQPYGSSDTYKLGAEWLAGCDLIEDWGCGKGFLRTLVPKDRYRGIDGTDSRFCDDVVDLTEYTSSVQGVFMRHVLEHNREWAKVLDNAVASFTKRMVLILFTPAVAETHEIGHVDEIGVPDIAFAEADLVEHFGDAMWTVEERPTQTYYGAERIFRLER